MIGRESNICNTWLNQIKMLQKHKRKSEAGFAHFEEEYRRIELPKELCHV